MQKYIKIFRKLSLIMTLKVKISRKSDIEMTSGIIFFLNIFHMKYIGKYLQILEYRLFFICIKRETYEQFQQINK